MLNGLKNIQVKWVYKGFICCKCTLNYKRKMLFLENPKTWLDLRNKLGFSQPSLHHINNIVCSFGGWERAHAGLPSTVKHSTVRIIPTTGSVFTTECHCVDGLLVLQRVNFSIRYLYLGTSTRVRKKHDVSLRLYLVQVPGTVRVQVPENHDSSQSRSIFIIHT